MCLYIYITHSTAILAQNQRSISACFLLAKFDQRISFQCVHGIKMCSGLFKGRQVYIWETFAHYGDVIMGAIASEITSLTIVYSTVYSDADERKHQSSASLAFVRGIHRGPVNSPHKWPVTRKKFPFDDVIMRWFVSLWLYIYFKFYN